jgi:hypothetical protein
MCRTFYLILIKGWIVSTEFKPHNYFEYSKELVRLLFYCKWRFLLARVSPREMICNFCNQQKPQAKNENETTINRERDRERETERETVTDRERQRERQTDREKEKQRGERETDRETERRERQREQES